MKQLLELLPIALFFIVYQFDGATVTWGDWHYTFDGIFSATAVLIGSSIAILIGSVLVTREWDKRQVWTVAALVVFGGATLVLRDETFIQWKPSVFNWGLALVFGLSGVISQKTICERMLGSQIHLPKVIWRRMNWLWTGNFFVVGTLNIFVAYQFSEAFWVSYKLYSAIGFTVALIALTALLIGPYLSDDEPDNAGNAPSHLE